jgi:hypothetical protein
VWEMEFFGCAFLRVHATVLVSGVFSFLLFFFFFFFGVASFVVDFPGVGVY